MNKTSLSRNLGTNLKELQPQHQLPKNQKEIVGIKRRNQNLTWCFAKIRPSKRLKLCFKNSPNKNQCFLGKQQKHHAFSIYYNATFFIRIRKCKIKKNLQKVMVPLFMIQTSTLFPITHLESSCEETKWYSITLTILIHYNTFTSTSNFNICIRSHINHLVQSSFHIYVLNTYACLKFSIINVSTSLEVKDSCLIYSFTFFLSFVCYFPLLSFQQVPWQLFQFPETIIFNVCIIDHAL